MQDLASFVIMTLFRNILAAKIVVLVEDVSLAYSSFSPTTVGQTPFVLFSRSNGREVAFVCVFCALNGELLMVYTSIMAV